MFVYTSTQSQAIFQPCWCTKIFKTNFGQSMIFGCHKQGEREWENGCFLCKLLEHKRCPMKRTFKKWWIEPKEGSRLKLATASSCQSRNESSIMQMFKHFSRRHGKFSSLPATSRVLDFWRLWKSVGKRMDLCWAKLVSSKGQTFRWRRIGQENAPLGPTWEPSAKRNKSQMEQKKRSNNFGTCRTTCDLPSGEPIHHHFTSYYCKLKFNKTQMCVLCAAKNWIIVFSWKLRILWKWTAGFWTWWWWSR